MKTLLSISLIFLFVPTIFSQQFVRKDAQWVYNYHGAFGEGYTLISYEQDTVLFNRTVKQFGRYHTRAFNSRGARDTVSVRTGAIFLYESNGIVEYSMRGHPFDTLFNYNSRLGETFAIDSFYVYTDTSRILDYTVSSTVIDTFHLRINAKDLFSRKIEYKRSFVNGRQDRFLYDTLVQYLGLLNRYIDPTDADARVADGGEGGYLRCYKNDDIRIIESPGRGNVGYFAYDCDKLSPATSTDRLFDRSSISSYPNPSNDMLIIENAKNNSLTLKLIDYSGRTHEIFTVRPGKNEISISHLPAGLYFLLAEGEAVEKIWIN